MKNKTYGKAFLPVVVVFLVCSIFVLFAGPLLKGWNADTRVLLGGNELLFALTCISYLLHIKSLRSSNPHVFVRMVYGGLVIKMLVCLIAVGLYGWLSASVNKQGILGCFILYVVYTFLEIKVLIKFLKKSPNNV